MQTCSSATGCRAGSRAEGGQWGAPHHGGSRRLGGDDVHTEVAEEQDSTGEGGRKATSRQHAWDGTTLVTRRTGRRLV